MIHKTTGYLYIRIAEKYINKTFEKALIEQRERFIGSLFLCPNETVEDVLDNIIIDEFQETDETQLTEIDGDLLRFIVLSRNLIEYRSKRIFDVSVGGFSFSRSEILCVMYSHIIDHEIYHMISDNPDLITISGIPEDKLSEEQKRVLRFEELAAERYAISATQKNFHPILAYLAVHFETIIRNDWHKSRGTQDEIDEIHMSDKEILDSLEPKDFSVEIRNYINEIAIGSQEDDA